MVSSCCVQSRPFSALRRTSCGSLLLALSFSLAIGCNRDDKDKATGPADAEKSADKQAADKAAADTPSTKESATDSPTAQRVAVVDATRATNVLGFSTQINNQLQAVRIKYQPTFQQLATEYSEKIEKKQSEIGDKPSEAQQKDLQAIFQERDQSLQRLQAQVEQELAELQQTLFAQARNILRPAIKRVAKKRGYTLVINGDMAYSAAGDDITEDVILEVRAKADELQSLEPPFEEKDKE